MIFCKNTNTALFYTSVAAIPSQTWEALDCGSNIYFNPKFLTSLEKIGQIVDKELEIIKAEITNSGKPIEMAEKISKGKISKFLNDNSLLNQVWIMDPKKKVSDILKENSTGGSINVLDFIRYKVGEGV